MVSSPSRPVVLWYSYVRRALAVFAFVILATLAVWLLPALPAAAHEVRPAYLEIAANPTGYQVVWKQPVVADVAVPIKPRMSGGWLAQAPQHAWRTPAYRVQSWRIEAPAVPLAGQTIAIDGLDRTITDALVRIRLADGSESTQRLTPDAPSFIVGEHGTESLPVAAYLRLGIEHILTGVDHLLFVFGLMLLVVGRRRLAGAITAFTAAHSLSLALAALGWVQAPVALVEAAIALSIVFVAVEIVQRWHGQPGLTSRRPWLVAFAFGLLHGFGFAGALAEIGLPANALVPALLLFNLGVELGQLAFIAAVLAARCLLLRSNQIPLAPMHRAAAYTIGGLASYWFIERTVSVFAA